MTGFDKIDDHKYKYRIMSDNTPVSARVVVVQEALVSVKVTIGFDGQVVFNVIHRTGLGHLVEGS